MNRNFLTTIFAANMLEKTKGVFSYTYEKNLTVEDLKGIEFISALTNKALSDYFLEKGIETATIGPEVRISLRKGDTVYLVNPGITLHDLKGDILPPYANVTITKITYFENPQLKEELENNV